MAAFSFAYNPFVILPVSIRASSREVDEAFAKRLAARPQDEAQLARARRLLLEPESRLAAEVAWLVDVGPREAVALLGAMAGGDEAALLAALNNQPALTKANVAADACVRLKSANFLPPLTDAHRNLDPVALAGQINDIHVAIPIAKVTPRQVEAALGAITLLHAASAMEAIAAQADPAVAFASATEGAHAATGAFLTELTAQYRRRFPVEETVAFEPANDLAVEGKAAVAGGEIVHLSPGGIRAAHGGAFADVHAVDNRDWPRAEDSAADISAAFMDAQLIFTEHGRFDTWGNSRKVRRVLYLMGGGLAALILVYLVFGKGPSDGDANANVTTVSAPTYSTSAPPAPKLRHKECIHVSGAVYCTG